MDVPVEATSGPKRALSGISTLLQHNQQLRETSIHEKTKEIDEMLKTAASFNHNTVMLAMGTGSYVQLALNLLASLQRLSPSLVRRYFPPGFAFDAKIPHSYSKACSVTMSVDCTAW